MSSTDSRILFVSGGEVTHSEVRTSSGILGIFVLLILMKYSGFNSGNIVALTGLHTTCLFK